MTAEIHIVYFMSIPLSFMNKIIKYNNLCIKSYNISFWRIITNNKKKYGERNSLCGPVYHK